MSSITDFTSDIYNAINNKEITVSAFIDLKKTFDTVNHKILLEKLNYLGIKGKCLNWILDYLSNRTQATICNNFLPKSEYVKCGVPQGSILGPLFFLVYINDVQGVLGDIKYRLYADDTVIYCSGKNHLLLQEKLHLFLNKFSKWCKENALTINTSKTKIMTFGSRSNIQKANDLKIFIDGEQLKAVPTYKYLGVNLDQTFNFKYHLGILVNAISFKLYLFNKIRKFINEKSAIIIYKSMVLPYFDYCDVTYMFSKACELGKLNRLHKRGMRISLTNGNNLDENELFNLCKLSNLDTRRHVHLRHYMFNSKNKCIKEHHKVNTRLHDGPVFDIPKPNNDIMEKKCNIFRCIRLE